MLSPGTSRSASPEIYLFSGLSWEQGKPGVPLPLTPGRSHPTREVVRRVVGDLAVRIEHRSGGDTEDAWTRRW